jgi:hypothetical protein
MEAVGSSEMLDNICQITGTKSQRTAISKLIFCCKVSGRIPHIKFHKIYDKIFWWNSEENRKVMQKLQNYSKWL